MITHKSANSFSFAILFIFFSIPLEINACHLELDVYTPLACSPCDLHDDYVATENGEYCIFTRLRLCRPPADEKEKRVSIKGNCYDIVSLL